MTPPPDDPAAGPPPPTAPGTPPKDAVGDFPRGERRFIFVQLLFSLTAADTAREFGELYLHGPGWREAYPAYTHLVLAAAVIIASWVGWSSSKVSLSQDLKVTRVFALPFLVLLLDVVLVGFYFILVRTAEAPDKEGHIRPSAAPEAVWVMCIFAGYTAWDFVTKGVLRLDDAPASFSERFRENWLPRPENRWPQALPSAACAALAAVGWYFLSPVTSPGGVAPADASLLCLVLLFRVLKEKPRWWVRWAHACLAAGVVAALVARCYF